VALVSCNSFDAERVWVWVPSSARTRVCGVATGVRGLLVQRVLVWLCCWLVARVHQWGGNRRPPTLANPPQVEPAAAGQNIEEHRRSS
jgi:hypothetical protein